jgi:hypothetical protein
MLASPETILITADAFRRYKINTTVIDPVCSRLHFDALRYSSYSFHCELTTLKGNGVDIGLTAPS